MLGAHEETIAALSTPSGDSGIAVVRVSGSKALSILTSIFAGDGGDKRDDDWQHQRIYHGRLVDGEGDVIDEVMCGVMRAPASYTGEDTVEISCHGNALVVSKILDVLFATGARPAQAGEFTKRAFLNGKLDLIQAEAVADLIHARSELQRRVAQEQLAGGLSARIHPLADDMLELLGNIEANIDFIEEGIDTLDVDSTVARLDRQSQALDELLRSASFSRPFREGYTVAIAGPVNAGKSSLFNRLIGEQRAIVTDTPGTTRDVIREPIILEGLIFNLHDTAGLRASKDRVERIGVGLAEAAASTADLVLFVIDSSEALTKETTQRLDELDGERSVVAFNKTDLPSVLSFEEIVASYPAVTFVPCAVTRNEGIDAIRKRLIEHVGRDQINWVARERVVLNTRLISLMRKARERIAVLSEGLRQQAPLEILALDAREALQLYETATGRRYTDDLLDSIFSRFCIGK